MTDRGKHTCLNCASYFEYKGFKSYCKLSGIDVAMEQAFDFCELWTPKLDPLTIVKDKYNGTYSDALYTAWNLEPCQLPVEIFSDENTCREMWLDINTAGIPVGRSSRSVQDAELDLQINLTDLHHNGEYDVWWGKAIKTYLTWDEIMTFLMGEEYRPTHYWDE